MTNSEHYLLSFQRHLSGEVKLHKVKGERDLYDGIRLCHISDFKIGFSQRHQCGRRLIQLFGFQINHRVGPQMCGRYIKITGHLGFQFFRRKKEAIPSLYLIFCGRGQIIHAVTIPHHIIGGRKVLCCFPPVGGHQPAQLRDIRFILLPAIGVFFVFS